MTAPLDVRFWVQGDPVPKGNMSGFPIDRGPCQGHRPGCAKRNCFGGRVVGVSVADQGGAALEAWQSYVHYHAVSARNKSRMSAVEAPSAVEASMVFVFERPAGHWTADGRLTAEGRKRLLPVVKPDFDKVTRAIADGLKDALISDDAIVVVASVAKVYAARKQKPGVVIHARQIADVPQWVREELTFAGVSASIPSEAQGALL